MRRRGGSRPSSCYGTTSNVRPSYELQYPMRKGAIKLPEVDDDEIVVDQRSQEFRQFAVEDPVSLDTLREVFAGTDLTDNPEKVQFVLELRGEVRRHWGPRAIFWPSGEH